MLYNKVRIFSGLWIAAALFAGCASNVGEDTGAADSEQRRGAVDDLERICKRANRHDPNACQPYWYAEYYGNRDLAGAPVDVVGVPKIDFDWGHSSPSPKVPVDNFSARWTKSSWLPAGSYNFTVTADDGVRLYIDGRLVIDDWRVWSTRDVTANVELSEGVHTFQLQYFEAEGGAVAKLSVRRAQDSRAWFGEYFANPSLSGAPTTTRYDQDIHFEWGTGHPAPGLPADNFSVRWTRSFDVPAGRYRVHTRTDDGVRVYVDGSVVIDDWNVHSPVEHDADVDLGAGSHFVKVEYFEGGGGATAQVSFEPLDRACAPGQWRGEYFSTPRPGQGGSVRCDDKIDFDWAWGGPGIGHIGADDFSARWTKRAHFGAGEYTFNFDVDDRMVVKIDGREVVRVDHPAQGNKKIYVGEGEHEVVVEYEESWSTAHAKLDWVQGDCIRPGNVFSCTTPHLQDNGAWVRISQQTPEGAWREIRTSGSIHANGFVSFFGAEVDTCRYGAEGHPYLVEQYKQGRKTAEAVVNVKANADTFMPDFWGCPRSDK